MSFKSRKYFKLEKWLLAKNQMLIKQSYRQLQTKFKSAYDSENNLSLIDHKLTNNSLQNRTLVRNELL